MTQSNKKIGDEHVGKWATITECLPRLCSSRRGCICNLVRAEPYRILYREWRPSLLTMRGGEPRYILGRYWYSVWGPSVVIGALSIQQKEPDLPVLARAVTALLRGIVWFFRKPALSELRAEGD